MTRSFLILASYSLMKIVLAGIWRAFLWIALASLIIWVFWSCCEFDLDLYQRKFPGTSFGDWLFDRTFR